MFKLLTPIALSIALCFGGQIECLSQESIGYGDWAYDQDADSGLTVATMRMKLHRRAEPKPALQYRLIPDRFDQQNGNAAIYYLKAMGFLEQSAAFNAIQEFLRKYSRLAQENDVNIGELPPYSWLEMPIEDLPIDEVKEYLRFSSFQPPLLANAARQNRFELDRNLGDVENPVAYLLPEIQRMRELARKQSLRCRLAMAEGRMEDALRILGEQFAMAHHLGQDEFLVSTLVGAAVSGITTTDALLFVQHADAPNLYWAIAALPNPLIDMRDAYAFERQFFLEQVKVLREVDETPRPAGYWQDLIDRMIPQIRGLGIEGPLFPDWLQDASDGLSELDRTAMTAFIAASYPSAKRYLIDECGMNPDLVERYPTAQVVFLATVKCYRLVRDEYFKWTKLPVWQAERNEDFRQLDQWLGEELRKIGWAGRPVGLLLTAVAAARNAQYRVQQRLALLQTAEAIRMYAAENDGKLPVTLDDLPVPAPLDPFTGEPIHYEFNGSNAVLNARRLTGIRFRLILEIRP